MPAKWGPFLVQLAQLAEKRPISAEAVGNRDRMTHSLDPRAEWLLQLLPHTSLIKRMPGTLLRRTSTALTAASATSAVHDISAPLAQRMLDGIRP